MRERICNNCGGKQYKLVGQNMVKCCFCGSLYVNEEASKEEEVLLVGVRELLRSLKFEEALQEANNLLMLFPYSFEGYFLKSLAKNKVVLYRNKTGTKVYPVSFDDNGDLLQDKHFGRAIEVSPSEIGQSRLEIAETLANLQAHMKNDTTSCDVFFLCAGDDEAVLQTKNEMLKICKEKGLVVFDAKDRFKSYGASLFKAIKSAKACIVFAGKENLFSDASRKMVVDAYKNEILEQRKVPTSLILVTNKSKISMAKLPDELAKTKTVVDVGQGSTVEDVFGILSQEMNKTVKIRVKLDKKEIAQVAPQKKEYVDIESVETTELGHYAVENVELDKQNKIKWIFLMLKNQDFAGAGEAVAEELSANPNEAELLFAQLLIEKQIATKEQFFESISNFADKDKIEKVLTYASKEFAEEFVDAWEELLIKLNSVEHYNQYLLYLAKFETSNREKFIKSAEDCAIESLNADLIEKVEKCFDSKDVDRFINFYFSLAQKSDDAIFYNKILELDIGHEESNHFVLLEHFKTTKDILSYRNKEEIEGAFQYLSPKARARFVEFVVNLILPVAYCDLTSAQEQIDFYLSYLSSEELPLLLKKIYERFRDMSFFTVAEKYVALAISQDKQSARLYWELIKTKIHCKTDQEVILSKTSIAKLPEWQTLLSFASEEEADEFAKVVSKSNLYKGEKKSLADEMQDLVSLKQRLDSFIDRNKKIILEFEKENLADISRGTQYYKMQLVPFEKILKELDKAKDFDVYCDVTRKLKARLDAMDLNLEASIKISSVEEKGNALKEVVQSVEEAEKNLRKVETREKQKKKAKTLAYWLLCALPVLFTTILLTVFIFMPKEVYMEFSQSFLIEFAVGSVVFALVFLVYYFKIKNKKNTTKAKIASIFIAVFGFLNIILLAVGMVFVPKVITISNNKEFEILIKNANSASVCLECDIDLNEVEWQGGNFYGEFDGKGHTIKNLKFDDKKDVGLFVFNGGTITNLHIELQDGVYQKVENFGAFACTNTGAISNCSVGGTVAIQSDNLEKAGGFVAENKGGKIELCVNKSELEIQTNSSKVVVGGFVAQVDGKGAGLLKNLNLAKLNIQINGKNACVGGMIGSLENVKSSNIEISQNANEIEFSISGEVEVLYAGGIAGMAKSQIENCYVSGDFNIHAKTTKLVAGGIVGEFKNLNFDGKIQHCYSILSLSAPEGAQVANLVGSLGGAIEKCFTNQEGKLFVETLPYSKQETVQILSGFYSNAFGFDHEIWEISTVAYPKLKWQVV